jgi:hypothetical protein
MPDQQLKPKFLAKFEGANLCGVYDTIEEAARELDDAVDEKGLVGELYMQIARATPAPAAQHVCDACAEKEKDTDQILDLLREMGADDDTLSRLRITLLNVGV